MKRFKRGDIVKYRLNQSGKIKKGEIIEVRYSDVPNTVVTPNFGDFYIIADGMVKKNGTTSCYVVNERDIV